jgi:epoxyqueuosine reductase
MPSSTSDPRAWIRAHAREEGFEVVRFARAEGVANAQENLERFLAAGSHGTMDWLARNPERRGNPGKLWPEAKSIILLGANYGPAGDPLKATGAKDRGAISVYAQGDDYHDVLKKKLRRLAADLAQKHNCDVKLYVDTAPVMEKPLAQRGGIGWQGKHTNLVSREFGSWLFLGSIFTTLELQPDEAESDHCGQCRRCLDICPTNAFPAPYRIDATRCISYLTIEHKGHIAREFREAMGNRIYGCDDCLAICPWNKFAQAAQEARFHARSELVQPTLIELVRLDDASFRTLFRRSPVKRIGRDRFVRNVLIAIGNSGDKALASEVQRLLDDASALVRAMAVWALGQLLERDEIKVLAASHAKKEIDAGVLSEWMVATAFQA